MSNDFIIIETTVRDLDEANKIAKILLDKKIAGCVNFQKIVSNYFWQEEIRHDQEILLSIKSHEKFFPEICQEIKKNHSYQIPQIFSIKIQNIDETYASWLRSSLKK